MSETHFGFEKVDESEKAGKVAGVFHSVASKYDVMNDLMSGGMHRLWKVFTIAQANVRPGQKVLDIAGGTGDLAKAFAKQAGPTGEVWLTDINESMLRVGRDRLLDKGVVTPVALCDAEKIPFPDNYFDLVTVAFGLRNMTHKDAALAEMRRVIKPGGKVMVLEFSKVWKPLESSTMSIPSRFCRGWASAWRGMPLAIAIWRNRSECIRPGFTCTHDGTSWARTGRILQSDGRSSGAPRREKVLIRHVRSAMQGLLAENDRG
jgi:demethylmenaquinone methyltransferase/2-methoxy-6-polyprenyl-1,4-benzoquinol methylase